MMLTFKGEKYEVNMMIWDMLGREGYVSTQARQIVGAQGVIIVGDITRPETLESMEKYWIPMILRTVGTVKLPLLFIGNKSDISDEDTLANAITMLGEIETRYNYGMKEHIPKELNTWFLSSAKTGEKVEYAFKSMAYLMFYMDRAEDPFYERIQEVVIKGLGDQGTRDTVIGVLDQVIFEFSEAFGNIEKAGPIIRQEIARAGMDHNEPKKDKAIALVEYLTDALVEEGLEEPQVRELNERWLKAFESTED
jgi:GTPase SAR1 family protein